MLVAYCDPEITSFTRGIYNWTETMAEDNVLQICVFGAINSNVVGFVRRKCDPYGNWKESNLTECLTEANGILLEIQNVIIITVIIFHKWSMNTVPSQHVIGLLQIMRHMACEMQSSFVYSTRQS